MVQKIGPEELNVILKFGGGLHTRASPDEIDARESAGGFNFSIDIQNRNLVSRPPFDLIGTAPNSQPIRGGATILKRDGTIFTGFQAGNTFYKWNSPANTFSSAGSCNANCRLRGHWRSHQWQLLDGVLISDLTLTDPVYSWIGTTNIANPIFTNKDGSPFGSFFAKYINVQQERAIYANVGTSGGPLPHVMVGSETSEFNIINTTNTPSGALGTGDAFFIPMPDLKPINGSLMTYLGSMLSTDRGQIFNLTGTDATNFSFNAFYSGSAASGTESVCEIGNDFIYGRQGRIESVRDTNTFGNSQAADMTAIISDQVATYVGWTIVFNSRTRKAYAFPSGVSEVWVLDAAIRDAAQLSPWMRWRTQHPMGFVPTYVASHLDPGDGLEYIIMGDSSGNIYRMEGTGVAGDGGTSNIDMQFLSKLVSARLDSKMYDVEGYVKYFTQNTTASLNLTWQYQGETIFANSLTVPLVSAMSGGFWNGGQHWNDGSHWGTIAGRLTRNKFVIPGTANEFQLLVEVNGVNPVRINEIGLRMRAASQ